VRTVFVQGAGTAHPELPRRLEARLGPLHVPRMPDPEAPDCHAWLDVLRRVFAEAPAMVVAHSLGGSVALKLLVEEQPPNVLGLLSLSAPFWGADEDWPANAFAIDSETEPRRTPPVRLCHGTADPVVPIDHLRRYQQLLPEARAIVVPEAGHAWLDPELDLALAGRFGG